MNKYVKELVGGSFIYGVSGMITSVIALFLIPIYTRVFTPSDYGILNLVNVTFLVAGIFIIFGMDNSAALWYWDKTEESERKKTFASWAYFSFSISLVLAAIIWLFSKQISVLIIKDVQYHTLFELVAVALVFNSWQKIVNIWFRVRKKAVWAVSYALTVSLVTVGLTILLVVYLDFGLSGVYWAQVGAAIVSFLLALFLMYEWFLPIHFDFQRMREMVVFAVPMVPAAISFWLMNSASSYFIQHYTDNAEVGIYQLGNQLASAISLAVGAFMQAWSPFAFSIKDEENHQQVYADVFLLYIYWGGFTVLGMFLFSPEVASLIAPAAYGGASLIAGLLGLNLLILGLPQIVVIGCALVKTNMPYSKAVIFGSIISVVLFVFVIPFAGKEGAVLATIAGNIFIFLYIYYQAQKLYFIPYNLTTGIFTIIGVTALSLIGLWISRDQSLVVGLTIKIAILIGYICFAAFASYRIKKPSSQSD